MCSCPYVVITYHILTEKYSSIVLFYLLYFIFMTLNIQHFISETKFYCRKKLFLILIKYILFKNTLLKHFLYFSERYKNKLIIVRLSIVLPVADRLEMHLISSPIHIDLMSIQKTEQEGVYSNRWVCLAYSHTYLWMFHLQRFQGCSQWQPADVFQLLSTGMQLTGELVGFEGMRSIVSFFSSLFRSLSLRFSTPHRAVTLLTLE